MLQQQRLKQQQLKRQCQRGHLEEQTESLLLFPHHQQCLEQAVAASFLRLCRRYQLIGRRAAGPLMLLWTRTLRLHR